MNMLRALAREQGIGGIVRIKKGVSSVCLAQTQIAQNPWKY